MKSGIPILLAFMSLSSCEKPAPITQTPTPPTSNPALAAAQLAHAQTHLDHGAPSKAIPYLLAAIASDPTAETRSKLEKTLTATDFTFPVTALRHPFPVLQFAGAGTDLFVALGGDQPTVIRWNLTGEEPSVGAVMFPAKARNISHLSISPDSRYVLIHRDRTNLLCHGETLKPIAALEPFPESLDPATCQPFSEKSLFVATPSGGDAGLTTWRIRDAASGEILRTESIRHTSQPVAAAMRGTTLQITTQDGNDIVIPLQGEVEKAPPSKIKSVTGISRVSLSDPRNLTFNRTLRLSAEDIPGLTEKAITALCGYSLDPATQALSEIPIPNRLEILSEHFPEAIPPTLKIFSADTAVIRRLADADPDQFRNLTAQDRSHADLIRNVFATGQRDAILAVIDAATPGLPNATALYLAIESKNPEFISRALQKSTDSPPALLSLAKRESSADTNLDQLRATEDWHGYESPDFRPLLSRFQNERADTLAAITLSADPTENDISALSLRLTDPEIRSILGKPLLAEKAIAAARTLSENPAHALNAISLSVFAQNQGTHPAACLRVRAAAHTTLGDPASAHKAWIELITEQPVAAHLPTDYTEAAHTAFETGDARQAIEILNTGLFRFPNAPSSAIRSAWIALLTDHEADALRYLNHAAKVGLPPDEIETTTALFAIAHAKLGDPDMAASHHAQLTAISPKWSDPESIQALAWPDPFKQSLLGIISHEEEIEPWPSPENDPTDTAPLPLGLPIEEPPLPSR